VQLDRLAVTLRLRNPWEAIDLGFAMIRIWMREVYAPWFALFLPLCVLASLILPPQWAVGLVWWLKPALDRVVLHVIANGVFGDLPRLRETLRALPQAFRPGLLASLTIYRFFFARSFNLPVWQLEQQRGRAARERRQQLQRRTGSYAVWLTLACMLFELALALSIIGVYDLLEPASDATGFDLFKLMTATDGRLRNWIFATVYFTVVTIIEPCYVAAGFALYLNRRTALEGWDLEVALRRIGERLQPATRPVPVSKGPLSKISASHAVTITLILVGCLSALPPSPAGAQSADPPASTPSIQQTSTPPPALDRAPKEVKEILKRSEFDQYREQTVLEYLGKAEEKKKSPEFDSPLLMTIIEALAQLLRVAVWIALGVAIAFVLYYLVRRFGFLDGLFNSGKDGKYVPPDTLFGLDVRPESLPDDLAGVALQLARSGELLKALSLLYRGTLSTLLHRDSVELVGGDTEEDCMRKSMRQIPTPALAYLARLVAAWQRLAYARRNVPQTDIETLCNEWRVYFGKAAM
jgi:hypothetical protein